MNTLEKIIKEIDTILEQKERLIAMNNREDADPCFVKENLIIIGRLKDRLKYLRSIAVDEMIEYYE